MEYLEDIVYLEEIEQGNRDAYRHLVEKHKDLVFTIVVRVSGNREDAEEIAQDVFLKAFQKLSSFRKESKFSTWLYRIAYNESVTNLRKKKIEYLNLDEKQSERIPDEIIKEGFLGLDENEQNHLVRKILNMLNEEDNTLVTLFYLQETPVDEISEITGLSQSNVKVKLHRIRKRIYESLNLIMNQQANAVI